MKYFFVVALAAVAVACNITDRKAPVLTKEQDSLANKALSDTGRYTTIEWLDSTTQNLGKVAQNQTVELTWKLKNTGTYPLMIARVQAACGCTVAEQPTEPIAPGATGTIKARYSSGGAVGTQRKQMTVYANNRNPNQGQDNVLSFTADVQSN